MLKHDVHIVIPMIQSTRKIY